MKADVYRTIIFTQTEKRRERERKREGEGEGRRGGLTKLLYMKEGSGRAREVNKITKVDL